MNFKSNLAGALIITLCGILQASAQKSPNMDAASDQKQIHNDQYQLGKLERADKIIGKEVKDSHDQTVGRVKDLAIDMTNERIVAVILQVDGMLGVDDKYVAVPPEGFACDTAMKTLVLNFDKARIKEAPAFNLSQWSDNVRQPELGQIYNYYGSRPYFATNEQADQNVTAHRLGEVQRADKLMGTTVHNLQGERLGKVDDLVVDLPAGRLIEVILSSGGFLGLGNELSAIPAQSFRQGNEPDSLLLDTSKETLSSAPYFKSSEWPDLNQSNQVSAVYRVYNVEPDFATNAPDNTAQNARDRAGTTRTPLDQGSSQADMETTLQIRKQIMDAGKLSVDARNIKIITQNGRVTLRGTVDNQDEKRKIEEIANKVASAGNVDDQLQVENTSRSSNQ
jgi:sporulation protein YlmC with PRC-barrel domain